MSLYLMHNATEPSAGLILMTKEAADDYLMHYRVGGEHNGIRRWQDKHGKLTPAGYQHYKEMYGWGERSTRNARKSEKHQSKADAAHEKVSDAQYKSDKAKLKIDRNPNNQRAQTKKAKADSKLAKARLKETKEQEKAYKYASKDFKDANKYFNEDGTLNEKGKQKFTYSNGEQSKMNLAGRLKFGGEFAKDYESKQHDEAVKGGYTDRAKVNAEFERQNRAEDAARKAAEDAVESNRFVEGSKAQKADAAFEHKVENFSSLNGEEKQKVADEMFKRIKEDYATLNAIRDPKNASNPDYDLAADNHKAIEAELSRYETKLIREIANKSGNWNTGDSVSERHEQAMSQYNQNSDKEYSRWKEVAKSVGVDKDSWQLSSDSREYKKIQAALKNDTIYQSLKENTKKSEQALVKACLRDIGLSATPENISLIYPYVFFD